ncbi:MAG TPA: bacillithiol biosynthesis deacetylase BshB1 [Cytophagales bacterium]|nr:bacillithiol biosynthesis deacetylase BshB1 [Cytophagales bacterium]HAA21626.1 bacillithiol biosynthesis deacetylase BshB1 [Cytophagales bacterium]HAP62852.1 bacillithiol biosynthesis deacetylase BshB1 [Cytophagales bacterium]
MTKVDMLVLAAHPDDAELGCSGTIAAAVAEGKSVAIVDFTKGEMGTRGTPEIRMQESAASAEVLGLAARENLGFKDVFFKNDEEHQRAVVRMIRKYRPEVMLANAIRDRHPDHGKGGAVAKDAVFMSGLRMLETMDDAGNPQEPWRPKALYHYIQDLYIEPDFVVDVTAHWDTKVASIRAFKSQFFDPNSKEPASYISSPEFMDFLEARSKAMGHKIGVKHGEGFVAHRMVGVTSLFDLS